MSTDFPIPNPEAANGESRTPVPYSPPSGSRFGGPPVWRPLPIATLVIIGVCAAVFILQTLAGGSQNPDLLMDFGASYQPYFVRGEYWRVVMPMFLHIGWWHLAMNMYVLYMLGPLLERIYGYGRYTFIYIGAGITGSLLSMFHGHNVAAGASGAIMGVVGALASTGYFHRDRMPYPLARVFRRGRFTLTLLIFVVLTLASGYMVANIDNWGHIGGLAGGAVLGALMPPPILQAGEGTIAAPIEAESSQAIVWIPVAVVAVAMLATGRHYRAAHQVSLLLEEGDRLERAHQLDAAADRYRRAEQMDPQDERPHEELALLALRGGRPSEAVSEFSQALRANPASIRAQAGLAAAYQASGDLAKAQKAYQDLIGKSPRDPRGHAALADFFAGQKLYQQAIDQYKEVLRLSPDDALAQNNLAWIYATAEDPKFRNPATALDLATKAVDGTGWRDASVIDTLAEALYVNGKYAEAAKAEAKALQLEPNSKEFQEHMARYQNGTRI